MKHKNTASCFSKKEVMEEINRTSYKDEVNNCLLELTEDQKEWAESQISIFYLRGVAIPFGMIRSHALNLKIVSSGKNSQSPKIN